MISTRELARFAREAARMLAREADLAQFEVYCSSAEQLVMRLNYTSEIPSHGMEECKSIGVDGFAIRIVSRHDPHELATAHCAGDLSLEAMRDALGRARRASVTDPYFPGLPKSPRRLRSSSAAAGASLMRAAGRALVSTAWQVVGGAIDAVANNKPAAPDVPGLVLGGDLTVTRDRFALASSAFDEIRADEAAYFSASVTALIETLDAKGTAIAAGNSLAELRRQVPRLGRTAVTKAMVLRAGERPPGGTYRIVLGPQPLAEILCYMVMPSLTAGAFHAASSAYHGRFGAQIMDRRISLFDEPRGRHRVLARRITCEGLPTRRSELIRDGRLAGLLSSFYDAHRLAADEHRGEKLGPAAPANAIFPAVSGYRLGEGGVRRFDSQLVASASNVVMVARDGVNQRDLIRAVGDGIYVGRVWYTYPINGQRAGDFTCTISGDSYLIRNGELAAPLAPNSLRINANLGEIFSRPLELGKRLSPALVWGSPEVYYAPALAADAISLSAVGGQA